MPLYAQLLLFCSLLVLDLLLVIPRTQTTPAVTRRPTANPDVHQHLTPDSASRSAWDEPLASPESMLQPPSFRVVVCNENKDQPQVSPFQVGIHHWSGPHLSYKEPVVQYEVTSCRLLAAKSIRVHGARMDLPLFAGTPFLAVLRGK